MSSMPTRRQRATEMPKPQHRGIPSEQPEEYGEECGGKGGVPYRVFVTPPTRITAVTIWHRQYVDGIEIETDQGVLPRIGGMGKTHDIRKDSFKLDEDEVLTGISLEYWNYIDRITFHTNQRS